MRRREFILALGGAATWPLVARGQQGGRLRRIGVLRVARASPTTAPGWQSFLDELNANGFAVGRDLIVEMRWADEDVGGPASVAAELAKSNVDVMVVEGPEANLKAVIAASPTIPIVITGTNYDPIARGYIKSLARPGGNVTGVSIQRVETAAKQVDLLTQAFPGRTRLGILWDADSADQVGAAEQAAKPLGLEAYGYKFERTPYDADAAFRALVGRSVEMLLVQSSPLFAPYGARIADLAIEHRLPSMFVARSYVERGGLMSYGPDRIAAFRLTATYVAKILKGAKPADLPVEQPAKHELIVNLKTAKAMGIELPNAIILRADEVIE
jgi:putative ABC transport system substrate-binding protein